MRRIHTKYEDVHLYPSPLCPPFFVSGQGITVGTPGLNEGGRWARVTIFVATHIMGWDI